MYRSGTLLDLQGEESSVTSHNASTSTGAAVLEAGVEPLALLTHGAGGGNVHRRVTVAGPVPVAVEGRGSVGLRRDATACSVIGA